MSRLAPNPAAAAIAATRVATVGAAIVQMSMAMTMITRREVRAG